MAIDQISTKRTVQILRPTLHSSTLSSTANLSGTEQDVGGAYNGLLVVGAYVGVSGFSGMALYTSSEASFTEAAGNRVTLTDCTSDSTSNLTLSTNEFSIAASGIYVFQCTNLKRYVNFEYTSDDSDSILSVSVVTDHGIEQPWKPATSAY